VGLKVPSDALYVRLIPSPRFVCVCVSRLLSERSARLISQIIYYLVSYDCITPDRKWENYVTLPLMTHLLQTSDKYHEIIAQIKKIH
jgi:hypothetical protein